MKKIFFLLLILIITLVSGIAIWLYIKYVRNNDHDKTFLLPRLQLSVVQVNSFSAEKTEMTLKMLIKNQLPISVSTDSLKYKIFINNVEIIKDRYKRSIELKGDDSSWIILPVTIYNSDLISVIKLNEQRGVDTVKYRIEASLYAHILKRRFKVNIARELPLIHIPEVKTDHIEIDSLNFSRAVVQLHISVNNKNTFSLKAKNIAYEFSIEENKWIKGTIPGITDIKAKNTTEINIPLRISFQEMSRTVFDLIKKGKNVKYKLRLNFKVESENSSIKNSKVIIESSGVVKSLIKSAKDINNSKK